MKIVIISGKSGAGKSVALNVFEDLGFYCVDNIPITLIESLISVLMQHQQNIAISIDFRTLLFKHINIEKLKKRLPKNIELTVFFLDASTDVLLQRYNETRRLHPLCRLNEALEETIEEERQLLQPFLQHCDHVINTDNLSIYDLASMINNRMTGLERKKMIVQLKSFGFKYGLPKNSDYVFDVRCLPNPYWDEKLRAYTGLDQPIQDYLSGFDVVKEFIADMSSCLYKWILLQENTHRSYLTVSIGCTGGKHRSVYVVEQLKVLLQSTHEKIIVKHEIIDTLPRQKK